MSLQDKIMAVFLYLLSCFFMGVFIAFKGIYELGTSVFNFLGKLKKWQR